MRDPSVQCFRINTKSNFACFTFSTPYACFMSCAFLHLLFSGEREGAAPQTISVLISF